MLASDGQNDLLAGFFGARRQGKSTQVKHFLKGLTPARLLVWDVMNEYAEHAERVSTQAALYKRVKAERRYALRYCAPIATDEDMKALPARFDAFCSIAYEQGEVLLVADELHLVTMPGWAPPAWRRCLALGGHQGVRIIAVSHRPAQVDKVFFSLCNLVSTCRLNFEDDVATLANLLGAPRSEVVALKPYQFIARDMVTGELTRGITGRTPLGRPARARTAAPGDARSPQKNLSGDRRRRAGP